ncbi:MAG: hypothetical protein V4486_01880 [Patescibacteria group bacterium]
MGAQNICEGIKYTISATNTIALPISLENLPKEIIVNGKKLLLKPSFHVSLVCINEIINKHNITILNFVDSVVQDFCDFVSKNDIKLLSYLNEFKLVTDNNDRDWHTVVVLCKVSNLDKFFDIVNSKYKLEIEYPPTHITLYVTEAKPGIFLTDAKDVKYLTKPIPNPIGRAL